jgi:hypothetical protein
MTGIIKTDKLQSSAGNDALTIASNGDVGVGEVSPAQRLEVKELDQTGFTGIRVNNPNGNVGSAGIEFQVDATYSKAAIYQIRAHPNGGGDLAFAVDTATDAANWVAGDEKLRLKKDGGITFNGDTAAANALDDYEEGTWTPTMSTANVHHAQIGVYTKIGRMVSIQMVLDFTQGGTQFGSISGLPFTNSTVNYAPFSFREWYSTGTTMSSNLVIGSTTTNFIYNYANSRSATNNQRYGFAMSVTYIT